MPKKNYKSQYLHPKWQKKRLEILQRDNFTCMICGDKENTLHVHHQYYIADRDVWDYQHSCLWTLCEDCHNKEHKKKKDFDSRSVYLSNLVLCKFKCDTSKQINNFNWLCSMLAMIIGNLKDKEISMIPGNAYSEDIFEMALFYEIESPEEYDFFVDCYDETGKYPDIYTVKKYLVELEENNLMIEKHYQDIEKERLNG